MLNESILKYEDFLKLKEQSSNDFFGKKTNEKIGEYLIKTDCKNLVGDGIVQLFNKIYKDDIFKKIVLNKRLLDVKVIFKNGIEFTFTGKMKSMNDAEYEKYLSDLEMREFLAQVSIEVINTKDAKSEPKYIYLGQLLCDDVLSKIGPIFNMIESHFEEDRISQLKDAIESVKKSKINNALIGK